MAIQLETDIKPGGIVRSKSGRDRGRCYVVLQVTNDGFALLADGKYRTVNNPKRKNLKHLQKYNQTSAELTGELSEGQVPENHRVREVLKKVISI